MGDFILSGLILILSAVSGLSLAPTENPHEKVCRATSMGSPCAQGGVATLGLSKPGPDHGTGNPIDLRSGNKYQRETDLPLQISGVELVRHYNAMDPRAGALGRGWSWSYDTRIYAIGQQLQLVQADGSRLVFQCKSDECVSHDASYGEMHRQASGWRWFWPSGKQLDFDQSGRLIRISNSPGQQSSDIVIQRYPAHSNLAGEIDRIVASAANLIFDYALQATTPVLVAVHTPRGMFAYQHDFPEPSALLRLKHPRLLSVRRPDGMQRIYHYEAALQAGNTYALTGISIANPSAGTIANNTTHRSDALRTHSWRYDQSGRANLFIAGVIEKDKQYGTIPAHHAMYRAMPELDVKQDELGRMRALDLHLQSWPGLKLRFDEHGNVSSWLMRGLGLETWTYGNSITRSFADQSAWQWKFDRHQRVVSMQALQSDQLPQLTRIDWRANRPVAIEHPFETQIMRYGRHRIHPQLLTEREVHRPAHAGRAAWSYRERFRYNAQGQVSEHDLPEGGRVQYWWNDNRLLAIAWQDPQGQVHPVIDASAAGIRHGNGLVTSAMKGRYGLTDLILYQPQTKSAFFHQQLYYNARGVLIAEHIRNGAQRVAWKHRRDPLGQFLPQSWPLARDRVLRDVTGLPSRVGDSVLQYSALRRLQRVSSLSDPGLRVQYAHNAGGERIWRDDGTQQTHYLYDQHKVVAEARVHGNDTRIIRRYIYAQHVPVAVIENGQDLYMIHTDAVGLPWLLTDAKQRVRWQGHFTPYGELLTETGDLTMSLRLPGQIADPATGWHDNYQRTYDPHWGQYLEPDPLGPMPGQHLYGYAGQQPRVHADPLGLMLFAFDGTGNQPSSLTNVWLFAKAYQDGPVHYIAGPAGDAGMTQVDMKTDAAIAWSGGTRVDQQWERLLNAVANLSEQGRARRGGQHKPLPIDIVGFSRGAALARHFGNRVVEHVKDGRFTSHHPLHGVISNCVDLRFVGLFDTVAQFNVLGAGNAAFNLTISPAWKWVSHAVALHEHRWLFPLTSAATGSNVVERAFVGAHADIGGGYLTTQASPGSTPGNLSHVALRWMQWQAEAAGVSLNGQPQAQEVDAPYIHDERAVFSRKAQNGDRRVNHANGSKWVNYQADLPRMGQGLRREVEAFINRPPDMNTLGPDVVGTVDMTGYVAWLKDSMGLDWR